MTTHHFLTEDHAKAALKADKGKEAEFISWEVKDFTKKGDNYASAVTSISIQYKLEGQENNVSYVVKLNQESKYEDFKVFNTTIFVKEAEFLDRIGPDLSSELEDVGEGPLRVPKQFHYSLTPGNELVILEDLRVRGFKMYDRTKGLDVLHTKLVVKELARMHAASVLLQAKDPGQNLADKYTSLKENWDSFTDHPEHFFNILIVSGFEGSWKLLDKIGGYEKPKRWIEENKDSCFKIMEKHLILRPPFVAINHGDCWNNNLLFRYGDDGTPLEVMLIDLQLSQVASPTNDLNYLLFSSLTGDVRKPNLEQFLTDYYEAFCVVVKKGGLTMPFTYEELLKEYKAKNEYGLLFATSFMDALVRPQEDLSDLDFNVDSEEEMAKMMEDWNEAALKQLDTNPLFKPRFKAVFDEMLESGVFD